MVDVTVGGSLVVLALLARRLLFVIFAGVVDRRFAVAGGIVSDVEGDEGVARVIENGGWSSEVRTRSELRWQGRTPNRTGGEPP